MPYAYRSSKKRDLGIVEDLEDQSPTTVGTSSPTVVYGDSCRLLPTVLQSKKGKVNRCSYIAVFVFERYSDYAAGVVQTRPPLIVGLSHPLVASNPRSPAKTTRNANLSLKVKRNAAAPSTPYVRPLMALAH